MCDQRRPADDPWPEGKIVEAYWRGDYGYLDRLPLRKPDGQEPERPEEQPGPHDPGE